MYPDVAASNGVPEVTVEQTYANTGDSPIEAVYVFPASTRAAVHGVEMRIGERVIVAKIQEKEQAKARMLSWKQELKENPNASPPGPAGGMGVIQ